MKRNKGIIYLVQPAELVGTDRYKVGYSGKADLSRLGAYKKGTRYLCIGECVAAKKLEDRIKELFEREFKLVAGKEYFEGDEWTMIQLFMNEFRDHMKLYMNYSCDKDDGSSDEDMDESDSSEDTDGEIEQDIEENVKIEKTVKRSMVVKKRPARIKRVSKKATKSRSSTGGAYKCDNCENEFKRKANLDYHIEHRVCKGSDKDIDKEFECKYCSKKFTTATSMYRHVNHTCKLRNIDRSDEIFTLSQKIQKLEKESKSINRKYTKIKKKQKIIESELQDNNT